MTRVEKYRKYRSEIANMKTSNFSSKKEAFDQVEKIHDEKSGSGYDYDNLMEVYDIYKTDDEDQKQKKAFKVNKYKLFYVLIAIFIIAIIIVLLVITGINIWGK